MPTFLYGCVARSFMIAGAWVRSALSMWSADARWPPSSNARQATPARSRHDDPGFETYCASGMTILQKGQLFLGGQDRKRPFLVWQKDLWVLIEVLVVGILAKLGDPLGDVCLEAGKQGVWLQSHSGTARSAQRFDDRLGEQAISGLDHEAGRLDGGLFG